MALVPTINLCLRNGCKELIFTETTGSTSSTAYGVGGNNVPSDFVTATLLIIDPTGIEYTIDLFAQGFPSDDPTLEYQISLTDLNRTYIEDGYWQFVYSITGSNPAVSDKTATFAGIFTCNSRCCVQNLLLKIDEQKFGIDDKQNQKYINNYLKAKAMLDSLVYYANCGNLDMFDNIKAILDKLCANIDCQACN